MLELSRIYAALGAAGAPEPPHQFTVGDLANVSFDEDGRVARLVLAEQALAGDQARAVREAVAGALPIYISVSPAGRICYHLVADSDEDQSQALIEALNTLVAQLAADRGWSRPRARQSRSSRF